MDSAYTVTTNATVKPIRRPQVIPNGERMPVWHRYATEITEGDREAKATDLIQKLGFNYTIEKIDEVGFFGSDGKMRVVLPGRPSDGVPEGLVIPDGAEICWVGSGRRSTFRHSAARLFRTIDDVAYQIGDPVSPAYETVQNSDLAKVADEIRTRTGWPIDSIGDMEHGQTFFIACDAGSKVIAGEDYQLYVFFRDTRGGDGGLEVFVSPVRGFCANVIAFASERSLLKVSLRHSRGALDTLRLVGTVIENLDNEFSRIQNELTEMSEAHELNGEEITEIINLAWPLPKVPKKLRTLRAALSALPHDVDPELVATIVGAQSEVELRYVGDHSRGLAYQQLIRQQLVTFNQEFPQFRNTPYAVAQAVAEVMDHGSLRRLSLVAAQIGARQDAKVRAYERALQLAHS